MKRKQAKATIEVKHYREKRDDDIENIAKLAVKAQIRLAKQGIELHWSMSYRPLAPTTGDKA